MNEVSTIRLCGMAGVTAAVVLLSSDWLMLGAFTDARGFANDWLDILTETPRWRVRSGAIVGPLGAWLYAVGFWQLYLALRPASRILAFACWAGFSIGFAYIAGAFHSSFPFIANAAESIAAVEMGGPDSVKASAERTMEYFGMLFVASTLPSFVGCLALAYAVLFLPTRFPRWTVVFNPLVLYVVTLTFRFVPAPFGGLLYIGYGNILFLMFFVSSTVVLWNGGTSDDLRQDS